MGGMRKTDARCDHIPIKPFMTFGEDAKNAVYSSDSTNVSRKNARSTTYRQMIPAAVMRNSVRPYA
jgi:hypothetical protein